MNAVGIVYLVGAGPGDPGLLTVKGLDCLRQADVVVYDHLANPEFLELAAVGAEKIYVGKSAGSHTLQQAEINALLVTHGQAGRRVVRLKGGDPFVFGRGGEEALALRQAGVPFEVIPGITAGIAGPAYAGIPVTHRGLSAAVTLVTGHEDPEKEQSDVDWESLARSGGTLVFYMGVANLPAIVQRLMACGMSPTTPVALVGRGTLPEQNVVEGDLATIAARVRSAGLRAPAVTVIGRVVALRQEIGWFERSPLFGRTIVVTRARTQASTFAAELRRLGARVLTFPTIAIAAPEDGGPLAAAVAGIRTVDWVLFTSAHAVGRFFAALEQGGGDARTLAGCAFGVTGPATAEALRARGLRPDLEPAVATSAALGEALCGHVALPGKRVLLPRSDIAAPELPGILRRAGAEVIEVTAYRTLPARPDPALLDALRAADVDIVTFTSSSTARNFAALMRDELGELPNGVKYVSIGPETSKAAQAEGLHIAVEATEHTIEGLTAALVSHVQNGTL